MPNSLTTDTIGIAMSGGVDSTVTAGLLLEQGLHVHGFFMLLPLPGLDQQISKARKVADRLGIPLHLVDLRKQFSHSIISYFVSAYQQGLTPNPCVVCNRLIKCGLLMEAMTAKGMVKMATGHYACIQRDRDGRTILRRAIDQTKDQSYFLCRLSEAQLDRLVLPLGDWEKSSVFQRAKDMGFTHFSGTESQDVCFLEDRDLAGFLAAQGVKSKSGEISAASGQVHGSHNGIWKYTVGQRRGLGIPDATPWYVTSLDAQQNRVIIGKNDDLFLQDLLLRDVEWHILPSKTWQGKIQLRSRHRPAEAQVKSIEDGCWQVRFNDPQRAITPGQFAVFYQDDRMVGSGIIQGSSC